MTILLFLRGERLQKEYDLLAKPSIKRKIAICWVVFWIAIITVVSVLKIIDQIK